jgi:hypothetical protein
MLALGSPSILHLMYHTQQQIYFTLRDFRDMLRAMIWSRRHLIALGALTFLMTVNSRAQRGALTVTHGLDQLTQQGGRHPPRLCNLPESRAASATYQPDDGRGFHERFRHC